MEHQLANKWHPVIRTMLARTVFSVFPCFPVFAFILSYAACLLYFITIVYCSLDGVNFVSTIRI